MGTRVIHVQAGTPVSALEMVIMMDKYFTTQMPELTRTHGFVLVGLCIPVTQPIIISQ